jgi:hypothetical protein
VKVRRRLQKLGAVALKQSVYILPAIPGALEDFQWLRKEIVAEGGEATLCEASFVGGLTDAEVEGLFEYDRAARYGEIAGDARERAAAVPTPGAQREVASSIRRLRARLEEVASVDFFSSPARSGAELAISLLETALVEADAVGIGAAAGEGGLSGRVWVTRRDVHEDRIASAWLIRRFVDPEARFKFVPERGYTPKAGEVRFDMFEAEFTHEGDRCTFETLFERLRPQDAALRAVSEIVHDIDLKDDKFERPETPGVQRLIAGIVDGAPSDEARNERGAVLFEGLYRAFGGMGMTRHS